jgi:hypothetical protein
VSPLVILSNQIDQQLPGTLGMLLMCGLQILGALGTVLGATPAFALAVAPLAFVYVTAM